MCPLSFSLFLSEPNLWHICILQTALIKHSSNVIARHPSSLPISRWWRRASQTYRSSSLTKPSPTGGNFLRDFFSFLLLCSLLEPFRDDASSISSGCSLLSFFSAYLSSPSTCNALIQSSCLLTRRSTSWSERGREKEKTYTLVIVYPSAVLVLLFINEASKSRPSHVEKQTRLTSGHRRPCQLTFREDGNMVCYWLFFLAGVR